METIADGLAEVGVIDARQGQRLREMAGYRNRMVRFYDEVTHAELYEICTEELGDVEAVLDAIVAWVPEHDTADGGEDRTPAEPSSP